MVLSYSPRLHSPLNDASVLHMMALSIPGEQKSKGGRGRKAADPNDPFYLKNKAIGSVKKAVQAGLLINLKNNNVKCTDCDNRASMYDHRDYTKPLDVEPVCRSCNIKRGSAVQFNSQEKRGWSKKFADVNKADEEDGGLNEYNLLIEYEEQECVYEPDQDMINGYEELGKLGTTYKNKHMIWKKIEDFNERKQLQANNTSGIRGVSYSNANKRWSARAKQNTEIFHLYSGDDFFEACCARKSWEAEQLRKIGLI